MSFRLFGLLSVWIASNSGGRINKITNAMTLVAYYAGDIAGAESFQEEAAPECICGNAALIMSTLTLQVFVCLALGWRNDRPNKKNRQKLAAMSEVDIEQLLQQVPHADITDRGNRLFVYAN